MLEHVALNQTRFNTPGVAPDSRGIVLGKQAALLFASIDRLVGFFRIFLDEGALDDIFPKLKILQVRTPLESRELLVFFHAASSYLVDRCARIATQLGGLGFTGSGKHFVKYRDNASPLGYDIGELHPDPADFVLYSDTFTQGYMRVKEVAFQQLVFRLSLRRLPGEDLGERELVWLTARRGLERHLLTYLWRNRVSMSAAVVQSEAGRGSFDAGGPLLLLRSENLPSRMLRLFSGMPGIALYRPVGDNCLVEVGYRHPLRLESCQALFDKERFYIFSGSRDGVDVLAAPPPLVPGQDLIGSGFELGEGGEPPPVEAHEPDRLQVELKLAASAASPRRVTGTLVAWERGALLKKLVYALPPTLLQSYRVAAIQEGLFIVGEQGIDGLPVGELYYESAPAIFLPLGLELLPRVSPEVLTEHVGGVNGRYVVFPRSGTPLALPHASFQPLGRRALARLMVETRAPDPRLGEPRALTPATVVNEESGLLPLWGFRGKPGT